VRAASHASHASEARVGAAEEIRVHEEGHGRVQKIDPILYTEANRQVDPRARAPEEIELMKTLRGTEKRALESRPPGLFPRELRVPTDTPPRDGWNYVWKPVVSVRSQVRSTRAIHWIS